MIEKRFTVIKHQNPNLSSLMCFTLAVKGFEDPNKEILRNFKKLVNTKDYQTSDYNKIIARILKLAKTWKIK